MKTKVTRITNTAYVPVPGDFFIWLSEPNAVLLATENFKYNNCDEYHAWHVSLETGEYAHFGVDTRLFAKVVPTGVDADGTLIFKEI